MYWIGTCGWEYPHWRAVLYPSSLPRRAWLSHYSTKFPAVEIDTTFYGLPHEPVIRHWAELTPPTFRMAIKASRYLTHVRHLHDPDALRRLAAAIEPLGPRRGPLLLQLPATARADLDALARVLSVANDLAWPVVLEGRHPSWLTKECTAVLCAYNATQCWTGWRGRVSPQSPGASWGYVRLHAGRAHPTGAYGHRALVSWAARLVHAYEHAADVYVMFNNDAHGCAPHNAALLTRLVRDLGGVVAPASANATLMG
ncbi:MAG: DUF72 domain-containing protein [Acidimicrobiia bacterium]